MSQSILQPAVQLRGLTKTYGDATVVNQLDLTIPQGETFGLIGPNGAGKSTTLKMLTGMLSITGGTATVLGHEVKGETAAIKQHIGYVPETHHIYRWMRVQQVIDFASSFYPNWNTEVEERLIQIFELNRSKKVKQLSKGMLAKLALLVAVSHEPKLLVLDEPMSGLDPIVREEFLDGVLQSVCDENCTVIFSSHTIEDVQRLADSIGLLCGGQLLVQRKVDELLDQTKRIRATLADGEQPKWLPESAIWQHVRQREWLLTVRDYSPAMLARIQNRNPIAQLEVQDLSLEDVFKDYVKGRKEVAA